MTHTLQVKPYNKDLAMEATDIKAVVYGPTFPTVSIVINQKDFTKLYKEAGESTVITLVGLDKNQDVLIHEVQKNVKTSALIHVDFYAVVAGQKIHADIPLVFTGVSAAVKGGADLVKNIFEIEVEAEAKDLPHDISVDLSKLAEVDDHIAIKDLIVPAGVRVLNNPEDVIVLASKHAEESEESATLDMSSIEMSTTKGKKEETE